MTNQISGLSALLDKLLSAGKEYAAKGQDLAEEKLNIPEQGIERDAMVDGMKKGALASAVLVGLLGTKTGRNLTGTAIKLGGLAALGTAAFKGYQNWKETGSPLGSSSDSGSDADQVAVHKLVQDSANSRSTLILKAMVSAAHADGHVDNEEIQAIRHELIEMHLPESMAAEVESILDAPVSAEALASLVDNEQVASEVYLATRLIINNKSSAQEQGYLQDLVHALGVSKELRESLDAQLV